MPFEKRFRTVPRKVGAGMRFKLFLAMAMSSFLLSCGDEGNGSNGPSIESSLGGSSEEISSEANSSEGGSQPGNSFDGTSQSGTSETASSEQGGVSSAEPTSSSVGGAGSSTSGGSVVTPIENKTIAGVAQKGPFAKGSSVKVYELDPVTFESTGKSFSDTVLNDRGEFSLSGVSLASQYALIEVQGYYWHELDGKKTNGSAGYGRITLDAIVDLSGRERANVNVLTHLERKRLLYLVSSGMDFQSAKKQAETEIFRAFDITGDFAIAEDLDIFSSGEGNAALFAIGAMMHCERSTAGVSNLFESFASDIEQDGIWDNVSDKVHIARYLVEHKGLGSARGYLNRFGENDLDAAFERIVDNFWRNSVYGLGGCAAENDGEFRQVRLQTDEYFICDHASHGEWRFASEQEYNTHGWLPGNDGEIRRGDVTAKQYKYDELRARWRDVNRADTALGLGGCTSKRFSEVGRGNDGVYYACTGENWRRATTVEIDTYMKECSKDDHSLVFGAVDTNVYVCDADTFRAATFMEKTVGYGCTSYNLGETRRIAGDMECVSSGEWVASSANPVFGTLADVRDGKEYRTVAIGTQEWMAENLNYEYMVEGVSYGNRCYGDSAEYCALYGRLYTWGAAMDTAVTGCGYRKICTSSYTERKQGICPNGWHVPTVEDVHVLLEAVGGQDVAGTALKSAAGWNDECNGTDAYGFSALPAGNGTDFMGSYTHFWGSFESDPSYQFYTELASGFTMSCNRSAVGLILDFKTETYSVRCVKD